MHTLKTMLCRLTMGTGRIYAHNDVVDHIEDVGRRRIRRESWKSGGQRRAWYW